MENPKRARSWKRRLRPRVNLKNDVPVLYSTFFLCGVQDSALPRLEPSLRRSKISPCPLTQANLTRSARSIAAVILCCFSESNISLALAFKHLNNKLASYICEAVECFGKQTERYS